MTIEGYTGMVGSGKTYAAVMETYRRRKRDPHMPVMTNLTRLDLPGDPVHYLWEHANDEAMFDAMARFNSCECPSPRDHEARELFGDMRGCPQRPQATMLLDEVGVFLPARVWNRMPPELSRKWNQVRKDRIDLLWTCVRAPNVVKDLRDITMRTAWCESWKGVGALIPGLGFFTQTWYSYTAVGDKRYRESGGGLKRFRPGLASELYDTMGKVKSPETFRRKDKKSITAVIDEAEVGS